MRRIIQGLLVIIVIVNSSVLFTLAQEPDPYADSDGDGLTDWDEINRYYSNPNNDDTDGDTIDDGREVQTGTSPLLTDSDGDHYSDQWEYANWDPLATRREDRYILCPYLADLPNLAVEVLDDEIRTSYTFEKGGEFKYETQATAMLEFQNQMSWGGRVELETSLWSESKLTLGLKSDTLEIEAKAVGSGAGSSFAAPQPYFEAVTEAGIRNQLTATSFFETQGSLMASVNWQGSVLVNGYTTSGWDMTSATIAAELQLSNTFDRLVKVERIIFDIGIGDEVYQSAEWPFGDIELPKGSTYTFEITFEVSGQEWVHTLNNAPALLSIDPNYLQLSVWSDGGWVSSTGIQDDVQTTCAQVEVVGEDWGTSRYICAVVDKIDGLDVLDALDRLFIPYTYKYGRMIDIMGERSRPGVKVWAFAYFELWYDPLTISDELNFQDVRMWGRGALTVDMQSDQDGDWLTDRSEIRFGTNVTNPDTDGDFADDYVELVLMRSNPFNPDTDYGGTIDGIEYYEHLNASDPSDDYFDYPDWYKNHQTIRASKAAADVLLDNAIVPDDNQLTWEAPDSPAENVTYHYDGIVTYVTNETLIDHPTESIISTAVGDPDNDGDNDVVVGTSPQGLVLLYENNSGTFELRSEPLANMSAETEEYYISPMRVMTILIGDVDNTGTNEVIFGTSYFDGSYLGGLYLVQKTPTAWQEVQQIDAPIAGGIYSIDIGTVDEDPENELVVGVGAVESLATGSVVIYSGSMGIGWSAETVAVRNSSRVCVAIGEFIDTPFTHPISGGTIDYIYDEILFCTYDDNSTLGWVGWDWFGYDWEGEQVAPRDIGYDNYTLVDFTNYGSDPWEKYMGLEFGDTTGDGKLELVVAIDRSAPDGDSIGIHGVQPIIVDVTLICDEFVFDDFDNDGRDEVVYHYAYSAELPDSHLEMYQVNSSGIDDFLAIENPSDPYLSSMAMGDVNTDGEIELVYGTELDGLLRLWCYPQGALWPSEFQEWTIDVTLLEPWIYQGEQIPIEVAIHNSGSYEIANLSLSLIHDYQLNNQVASLVEISDIGVESDDINEFEFWPISTGNYTLVVNMNSISPRVSHHSEYQLLVRAKPAFQADIGQAFLDLYLATNNETYLEAAEQVYNWLYDVRITVGGLTIENAFYSPDGNNYGWNGDAYGDSDMLLPGNILPTVETARFMLNLFRTTLESDPYLLGAVGAGYYLANSCFYLDTDLRATTGTYEGIVEATEIGMYLMDLNEEFLFDLYGGAVKGLANFLVATSQEGPAMTNWFDDPGLTQAATRLLARVTPGTGDPDYTAYAEGALAWLEAYTASMPADLSTGVKPDDLYAYYTDAGLAGLGIELADLRNTLEADISTSMEIIADEVLSRALP
ncbi:MAG: FG-GAP-like repeat-containing protein, partial [Candidatus Thorarchaeota archaeon]